MIRRPPRSTLLPYTTLVGSSPGAGARMSPSGGSAGRDATERQAKKGSDAAIGTGRRHTVEDIETRKAQEDKGLEESSTRERPQEARDAARGVAVELSGVTKRFGEFLAVDDLTLEIYEGEF